MTLAYLDDYLFEDTNVAHELAKAAFSMSGEWFVNPPDFLKYGLILGVCLSIYVMERP